MIMQEINASIGFDKRMWRQDIRGSLAHAAMLARAGIIQPAGLRQTAGPRERQCGTAAVLAGR